MVFFSRLTTFRPRTAFFFLPSEIPETSSFLDFARSRLCNPDPSLRPASLLEDVLGAHPYFVRREYLRIQRFLADLPLKTENEKACSSVVAADWDYYLLYNIERLCWHILSCCS